MHQLIATPYLGKHVVLHPGSPGAVTIPKTHYLELAGLDEDEAIPVWLADAARTQFGLDLAEKPLHPTVLIRQPGKLSYARSSYELNLGCNYDCEHCYLGLKKFEGLDWPGRAKLLEIKRDAGVVFIQLTGGEPTIDPLFIETYERAFALGMMISISTNASKLYDPRVLDMFRRCPPYRVTISVYGATETSYDTLVRRRGAFKRFIKGLDAVTEAGLRVRMNPVVTRTNEHEVTAMEEMARERGHQYHTYVNMTPTFFGTGEPLVVQSKEYIRKRTTFTGCNAGHTFFHADPHGMASICKIGRDDAIPLVEEGIDGLARLGAIADRLMLRTGGCSGCSLSGTCSTCPPLARQYHNSKAPRASFCQHPDPKGGE